MPTALALAFCSVMLCASEVVTGPVSASEAGIVNVPVCFAAAEVDDELHPVIPANAPSSAVATARCSESAPVAVKPRWLRLQEALPATALVRLEKISTFFMEGSPDSHVRSSDACRCGGRTDL